MRTTLSQGLSFLILLGALCICLSSCKKLDIENHSRYSIKERFFKLPDNADPVLKRVVQDLRLKEEQHPFVENFVKYQGYPIWKTAQISVKPQPLNRDGEPDTLIIIPIVLDSGLYVKDILGVKITDDILYKLYEREAYASYGFDKDPNRQSPSANDVVAKIMELEKELFDGKVYIINDNRLFDVWPSTSVKPEQFFTKNVSSKLFYVPTIDFGGDGPCNLYAVYNGGEIEFYYTTGNCGMPSMGGLDGGPDWTPIPPGGGGGDDPPTSQLPPCGSGWERLIVMPDGLYAGPCTSPTPIPNDQDVPDANGFYPSRIAELNQHLALNDLDLEPCDEIAALAAYGPMWQDVASYVPPTSVVTRLHSIKDSEPAWMVDDYNIENLEEANGTVINCDFFPIQISQMPLKVNGDRFTPREFLEYFRQNINSFISPSVDVNFDCHFFWFDDCVKWNSAYENSQGALCSVHLGGPLGTYNDGSIILSDYHGGVNPSGSESYWFTVSTIETPFDEEHPVAGNRRWGIYNTVQNPTQWTFYTMATDRTWDIYDAIANSVFGGFERADQLWTNMQENTMAFINSTANDGLASFYQEHNYIARPNWDDVKRFLRKEITYQELKTAMGC